MKEKIKKYAEVSGTLEGAKLLFEKQIETASKSFEREEAEIYKKIVGLIDFEEMMYACIIPTYEEHVSEDVLDALINFYETPEGKQLANVTPTITLSIMQNTQKWTQKKLEQLMSIIGI